MRKLVLRLAIAAALAASATLASGPAEALPIAAPHAVRTDGLAVTGPAQFIYLGKPYCWYPYGWAGAGWYWCGYGTHVGFGWGGGNGWNSWVLPRRYRTARLAPGYRFRRYASPETTSQLTPVGALP
jgi:hypothetical protein